MASWPQLIWQKVASGICIPIRVNQGTINILRKHIFRLFGPPPPPLRKHVLCTENKQNLPFSNPPSPYKCLRNICHMYIF